MKKTINVVGGGSTFYLISGKSEFFVEYQKDLGMHVIYGISENDDLYGFDLAKTNEEYYRSIEYDRTTNTLYVL